MSSLLIPSILHHRLDLFPLSLDNNTELTVDVYNAVHMAIGYRIAYWNHSHQEQSNY
jgi:hypothetical protein